MIRIELEDPSGIIVCVPTGVSWSNQAGGTACSHPEAEGVYVPLPSFVLGDVDPDPIMDLWHMTIGETTRFLEALELDDVFEPRGDVGGEAWVPVRIRAPFPDLRGWAKVLEPFAGMEGFIVYPNSD